VSSAAVVVMVRNRPYKWYIVSEYAAGWAMLAWHAYL
jgi:hypothetical protein